MTHKNKAYRDFGILAVFVCFTISGCGSYYQNRSGRADISDGRLVEGVAKLKQASESSPDDLDYRKDYLQERERAVFRLIKQAELALAGGHLDEAYERYANVLALQPDNARANAGLNEVEASRRHEKLVLKAENHANQEQYDEAIATVQQVLSENPQSRKAANLLKRLMRLNAEKTGKELGIYPKLNSIYRSSVSLSFSSATLKQVFESLKLASGLNYVFDKDVPTENRVTLSVTEKPVEDVLRLILATNQLTYRILDGDSLLIYPNTAAKSAEYKELVVRAFYLSNADVNKTAGMIKNIIKAKDIHVDERLNLILLRDTQEAIRLAEKLIAAADMVEPEVMLELEVMEVNVNKLKQIGLQWPSSASLSVFGKSGKNGQLNLGELNFPLSRDMFNLSLTDPLLSAQLRAQVGDSNVLANPRVRVRNRQSAKILIGDKVPVITVNNTANVGTAESVSYLDVGLKLDIEPTISLDDDVSMKLSLEVSNIVDTITRASGTQTYRLGTRNTSTVLRVKDGETNVLAGLIQKEDRRSNTGIPFLNELPLLSKLFGASSDSNSKTEIVLLITPHIIRNLDLPGVGLQEFGSGTESSTGAAPIQLRKSTISAGSNGRVVPPSPSNPTAIPPEQTPQTSPRLHKRPEFGAGGAAANTGEPSAPLYD